MNRWMWTCGFVTLMGLATAIAQPPGGPEGGGPGGAGGRDRPPSPLVAALDADRDGVISAEELKNATVALSTLDRNKDGKLTEDELRPPGGRPAQRGPNGGEAGGPGARGPGRGEGGRGEGGPGAGRVDGRPAGGPNPERMLAHALEFDADKDGKLGKEELQRFIADFVTLHADGGPGREGGPPPGEAGGRPNGPGGRPNAGGERPERPRRPDSE